MTTRNGSNLDDTAAQRISVVVLGMHRSGTSPLCRVFSLLGCDLPKTLMTAAPDNNELGFWESQAICRFNDRLLNSAGTAWGDWLAFNPEWFSSVKASEFHEEALTLLEAEFGASRFFELKDPRNCRMAPFWFGALEAAGVAPRVVIPIRNPLEVAASLEKRDNFDPAYSHLLWLRHMLDAEWFSRSRPRVFTSFDQLMKNWARLAARTGEALGISWPRLSDRAGEEIASFLSEPHRHHRAAIEDVIENPQLATWLREAFAVLGRWAEQGERPEDFATLDRIRAELDAAGPVFGRLIAAGRRAATDVRTLRQDLTDSAAKLHVAEAECDVARLKLAEGEQQTAQALCERNAAIEAKKAAEQALAEAQVKSAALEDDLANGARRLEDYERRVEATATEAAEWREKAEAARQELAQLRAQLSHTESALAQRRAEADAFAAELAEAHARLAGMEDAWLEKAEWAELLEMEFDAERERAAEQLADYWQEVERLETSLDQERQWAELLEAEFSAERADLKARLDAMREEMAARQAEVDGLHQAEKAARDAAEKNSREKQALEARIDEHFTEAATLTRLLKEKEALAEAMDGVARREKARADSVREMASVLFNGTASWRGRMWSLAPACIWRARQMEKLKQEGLFDPAAYLAANPDVAEAGVEPLRHFVQYGMAEARALTLEDALSTDKGDKA